MSITADTLRGLPAAPYSRVSKTMGKTGRSVGRQDAENAKTCAELELAVYDRYSDDDRSASKYSRKERGDWERLLVDIRAGAVRVLVVWEPSRATRDRMVWAALAAVCEEHHVYIVASGRAYDPTDPDDMFSLDLFFSLAVRESAVTRKRVNSDIRTNAAAGRPHGRLPYGYRREYEVRRDGVRVLLAQVPDETKAPIVRDVFAQYGRGVALKPIAASLNKRGVATPRGASVWRTNTLVHILNNRTYLGQRHLNGQLTGEGWWPAIIGQEAWDRCQARLTDPNRPSGHDSTANKLLSYLATCGVCGGRVVANSKNNHHPTYHCVDHSCVGRSRGALDGYVTEVVLDLLDGITAEDDDETDPRVAELQAELTALQNRLDSFVDSAGEIDGPSKAAVARIEARLLPQIRAVEKQLAGVRAKKPLLDLGLDKPLRELWFLPVEDGGLSLERKRIIIRSSVKIVVHKAGKGGGPYFQKDSIEITPLWQI